MKRIAFFIAAVALLYPALIFAGGKPRVPLQVTVSPVQEGLRDSDIRPGDIVEFEVSVYSLMNATSAELDIRLSGGAELVRGDTRWSGPLMKGESKSLFITVRASVRGRGEIRAVLTLRGDTSFKAHAVYKLGAEPQRPAPSAPPIKKDGRGRDIIEYKDR